MDSDSDGYEIPEIPFKKAAKSLIIPLGQEGDFYESVDSENVLSSMT